MKSPRPILSDGSASTSIRADLDVYSHSVPDYDATLGASEFAKRLESLRAESGAGVEAAESGSALAGTQAAALPLVLKTMLVVFGTTVLGVTAFRAFDMQDGTTDVTTPALAAVKVSEPVQQPQPSSVEAAKAAPVVPAEFEPTADPQPGRESRAATERESASRREIAQLMRVRSLLERDPAAAYRLAQASAREFPAGALREEREGLSVIALFAMGKASARAEAIRFLARYPESPLRDRIAGLAANMR